MLEVLLIVVGGGLGTLMRYGINGATARMFDYSFPWGTLLVNLIGSFIIGFMWDFSERVVVSTNLKIFLFIGLLGAFTTFSAYSFETFAMFRGGQVKLALLNILFSNVLGLGLVVAGFFSSRFLSSLLG